MCEGRNCEPGCAGDDTRLVCDAEGNPREERCPATTLSCTRSACQASRCVLRAGVGTECSADGEGVCNEAAACLGPGVQLSAILANSCARLHDGSVWCWGDNDVGQVGDGTLTPAGRATRVRELPAALSVAVGYRRACAVVEHGEVYCWGDNARGQAGQEPGAPLLRPTKVPYRD